jgi:hypothetical protein
MADVKVSALTALTGANLANGDQFLVTDVGSPNVSKSITADELAQGSQFLSRYGYSGTGSPEGSVTATVGARYYDTADTNGAILWVKESGSGNTGWRVVWGDTGWRSVLKADLGNPANLTFTSHRMRRINDIVHVRIAEMTTGASWTSANTSDDVVTMPTGFTAGTQFAGASVMPNGRNGSTGAVVFCGMTGSGTSFAFEYGIAASQSCSAISLVYTTTVAWPSSLPGTAV